MTDYEQVDIFQILQNGDFEQFKKLLHMCHDDIHFLIHNCYQIPLRQQNRGFGGESMIQFIPQTDQNYEFIKFLKEHGVHGDCSQLFLQKIKTLEKQLHKKEQILQKYKNLCTQNSCT